MTVQTAWLVIRPCVASVLVIQLIAERTAAEVIKSFFKLQLLQV